MEAPPPSPPPPPGPPRRAAPEWVLLAAPQYEDLAWRRAACRNAEAVADAERGPGGLLRLLQAAGLPVPPGTKGAINAYLDAKPAVSAAVGRFLTATDDPFYAASPKRNVNYGGKGAGQQLWWCGEDKGWRVTQPNRHMLRWNADGPPPPPQQRAAPGAPSASAGKRQRLDNGAVAPGAEPEAPIAQEDIYMLPSCSMDSFELDELTADLHALDELPGGPAELPLTPPEGESADVGVRHVSGNFETGPAEPETLTLGATHDRHVSSPSLHQEANAPGPAGASASTGAGAGAASTKPDVRSAQRLAATAARRGAAPALSEAEYFQQVRRLAERLPPARRQQLQQVLVASQPLPTVVAEHVQTQPPSPHQPQQQRRPPPAAALPPKPQAGSATVPEPVVFYPGSLEPVQPARWWRRAIAWLADTLVVRLLVPWPTRLAVVMTIAVAVDVAAHCCWPGQTVGKRLLRIQLLDAAPRGGPASMEQRWTPRSRMWGLALVACRATYLRVLAFMWMATLFLSL